MTFALAPITGQYRNKVDRTRPWRRILPVGRWLKCMVSPAAITDRPVLYSAIIWATMGQVLRSAKLLRAKCQFRLVCLLRHTDAVPVIRRTPTADSIALKTQHGAWRIIFGSCVACVASRFFIRKCTIPSRPCLWKRCLMIASIFSTGL